MDQPTCPFCLTPCAPEDELVACPGCATQHHAECLRENGGCTVFGCSQAPAEEPKISVSGFDVARGTPPPNGVAPWLNPDPLLEARVPPPPRPANAPAASGVPESTVSRRPIVTYPTFAGYAPAPLPPISGATPRKSRVVFVLLAVLLGAFGGHNFYAGYIKRAVIQLSITLFSCFAGSVVSWIWAVVEACIVDRDDDGVAFV